MVVTEDLSVANSYSYFGSLYYFISHCWFHWKRKENQTGSRDYKASCKMIRTFGLYHQLEAENSVAY